MSATIGINEFVRRQTPESPFSHYTGDLEDVARMVQENLHLAKPGYREGVVLVPVPPEGFHSAIVDVLDGSVELKAFCEPRRDGEDPFIQVVALGEKPPAKHVDIVLYSHETLMEDNDASTECDWEIISINAGLDDEDMPLTPMAMARNQLHLPGGTRGEYTPEEFAQSIIYWSTRVMIAPAE